MQEIKFRALETKTKELVYTEKIGQVAFWMMWFQGELDLETVTQYTGLKDKNGKGIYEGDIISSQYFIEQRAEAKQSVTGEWIADYNDGNPSCLSKELGRIPCEVIGNIYEHSHLLREEGE